MISGYLLFFDWAGVLKSGHSAAAHTCYGAICGTNAIMTFKVECWAPLPYQIQHSKQTVWPNYGGFMWLIFTKG